MIAKKNPGRFTIKFNICDPLQRTAAELLEQQGRRKAQFLANAISHYIKNDEVGLYIKQLTARGQEESSTFVANEIMRKAFDEKQHSGADRPQTNNASDLDAFFEDSEIPAITETLAAFHTGRP